MKRNNMCPFCYIRQLFMKKKPSSVNPTFEDYPVGAATTPPMGWSSWNTFANRINEKLILDTARAMKEKGLLDAGYHYVNLDDCWQSSLRTENGELYIPELENGTHSIIVNYSFVPTANMEGAYLSTFKHNGKEERLISTQFESHYARECFPCVDEPAAKAVFKLKITSEDPEDTILSNMPCDLITHEDDCVIANFPDTPRMSTYLVAFCVGKFHYVETKSKHGVRIRSYACINQPLEDLKYSADFAAEVLDFYDDAFKTPFPLPKMDLIAIPDFEAGAMENWGLVTYREIAMLANEKSSLNQKLYVCTVVAHELSHMWFGDLVTMQWWNDLWLNESFANMMEAYSVDKLRPELGKIDVPFFGKSGLPDIDQLALGMTLIRAQF